MSRDLLKLWLSIGAAPTATASPGPVNPASNRSVPAVTPKRRETPQSKGNAVKSPDRWESLNELAKMECAAIRAAMLSVPIIPQPKVPQIIPQAEPEPQFSALLAPATTSPQDEPKAMEGVQVTPPTSKDAPPKRSARGEASYGPSRVLVGGAILGIEGGLNPKTAVQSICPVENLREETVPLVMAYAESDPQRAALADYLIRARPDLTKAVMGSLPEHFSLAEEEA